MSIGLATYGATGALSLPLLKEMAARHPGVVVYINDSFGHVLSELIMTGRMDMAVDLRRRARSRASGCSRLFREELFLVAPTDAEPARAARHAACRCRRSTGCGCSCPGRTHFLRRLIDESFSRARTAPPVAAEIESVATLGAAVRDGLGATILPFSAAKAIAGIGRHRRSAR